MAEIQSFSNSKQLEMAAAKAIAKRIRLSEGSCCLSLSGGSTPKPVYELLASEDFLTSVPWHKCRFFWGDERCVPHNHSDSNNRMARETLLEKLPVSDNHIHPIPTTDVDPEEAALLYERLIRKKMDGNDLPRFDLILLGLGDDGHTASLFPGTRALNERVRLVVANDVPKLSERRITFTARLINAARAVMFIVAGDEKAEALAAVLEGNCRPRELPAQLISPTDGRLSFFIDEAAGKLLRKSKRKQAK